MSFKRGARNLNREQDASSEEFSFVSRSGETLWRIYDGPTPDGPARGFMPERWGADCIPQVIYEYLKTDPPRFRKEIKGAIRFLRFHTDHVKTYYLPEVWGVLADPPESSPTHGRPVRLERADRSGIGVVPDGQRVDVSTKSRLERLRASRKEDGPEYPAADELWVGNVKLTPEEFAYYTGAAPSPLIKATKELLSVNSNEIRYSHRPGQTFHQMTRVNPLTEIRASAADMPIQVNIPYLPEVSAGLAILNALKEYFDSSSARSRHKREHIIFDVEVIDYEELKRKKR